MTSGLTDTEKRALAVLACDPPTHGWTVYTCAMFGSEMWPAKTHYRNPQSFCRPAGKLLQQLKRKGLVEEASYSDTRGYRLSTMGRRLAKTLPKPK